MGERKNKRLSALWGERLPCHITDPQQLFTLHSALNHRIHSVCKDSQQFKSCVWEHKECPVGLEQWSISVSMLNLEVPSYSVPTRASSSMLFDACIKLEQESKAGSHCSDGDFPSHLCLHFQWPCSFFTLTDQGWKSDSLLCTSLDPPQPHFIGRNYMGDPPVCCHSGYLKQCVPQAEVQ